MYLVTVALSVVSGPVEPSEKGDHNSESDLQTGNIDSVEKMTIGEDEENNNTHSKEVVSGPVEPSEKGDHNVLQWIWESDLQTGNIDSEGTSGMELDGENNTPSKEEVADLIGSIKTGTLVWAKYQKNRYAGIEVTSLCPWFITRYTDDHIIYWPGKKGQISKVSDADVCGFLEIPLDSFTSVVKEKHLSEVLKLLEPHLMDVFPDVQLLSKSLEGVKDLIQTLKQQHRQCPIITLDKNTIRRLQIISRDHFLHHWNDGPVTTRQKSILPESSRDCHILCIGCLDLQPKNTDHPIVQNGFLCGYCEDRKEWILKTSSNQDCDFCLLCGWETRKRCTKCERPLCVKCKQFWHAQGTTESDCCFICEPTQWRLRARDESTRNDFQTEPEIPTVALQVDKNTPMRVLSLFDGISTALVALNELGIEVEKYYASEIDEDALMVSNCCHPYKITHLGDIKNITSEKLEEIPAIHILLGGSPCNDMSSVNPSKKGLTDSAGTGALFFEYFRLLKEVQSFQGESFLFLYENVSSMSSSDRNTITRFLKVEPVLIDAKYFSSMQRPRLFWSNIPGIKQLSSNYLKETGQKGETLQSHLLPHLNRVALVDKSKTVTTNSNSFFRGSQQDQPQVLMNGKRSRQTITEVETQFGLPAHYTDVGLSNTKRQKVLGKSWCVQVLKAIFAPLKEHFKNVGT